MWEVDSNWLWIAIRWFKMDGCPGMKEAEIDVRAAALTLKLHENSWLIFLSFCIGWIAWGNPIFPTETSSLALREIFGMAKSGSLSSDHFLFYFHWIFQFFLNCIPCIECCKQTFLSLLRHLSISTSGCVLCHFWINNDNSTINNMQTVMALWNKWWSNS